jgi:DNA-binding transcriptional LysR family regulator
MAAAGASGTKDGRGLDKTKMYLRRLRLFVAAAETENFGRAADRMHIARPALTRHIRGLEVELGVQLFKRCGRRVLLSEAGRLYAQRATEVLSALARAKEEVRGLSQTAGEKIRLGLHEAAGQQERVINALRSLRARRPSTELILKPLGSIDQIKALVSNSIDAGFIYDPPSSNLALAHINVAIAEWKLALPRRHHLASRATVCLADLFEEDFVSINPELAPAIFEQLTGACRNAGLVARIVEYAPDTSSVLALVSAERGVSFISSLTIVPPSVIVRPVADLTIRIPFDFVWRKDEARTETLNAIDLIAASFPRKIPEFRRSIRT